MHVRKKRRQLRHEVKKGLKSTRDDNVQSVVVKARRFGIFDAEDFEIQVDGWLSQDEKDRAEKVKTSRDFNKFLHTLGSKRIAQVAREMEEDTGETLNRCDMFMVTHTKKDENHVNELAGEAMVKRKTIIDNQLPAERVCSHGSIYWSSNDACGQVLGREHSGRVCGVGLGPTPGKSTSYTSSQGSISSAPPLWEQAMAIKGKQSSMGNNQEGKPVVVEDDDDEIRQGGA